MYAYQGQDYPAAIQQYLRLNQAHPSWIWDYNLGNAYYKNGQYGWAIYYYRLALSQSPRDGDIRHNLAQARSQRIDDIPARKGLDAFISELSGYMSFDEYGMLSFLLGLGLLGLILQGRVAKIQGIRRVILSILGFSVLIIVLLMSYQFQSHKDAVIVSEKLAVRSGPLEELAPLFYLHGGAECRIRLRRDQWSEIEMSNGLVGWVPNEDIQVFGNKTEEKEWRR